ncbi:hypothetical protein LC612_39070 [Nostoc sp. CHAB 5834]|nr:hypothetical protein [Nostoc sp. CHAB 5834]
MKNRNLLLAAVVLAATSLAAQAQSVHDGSQASALSTAGLSAAVAFVPLSVTIGGSALASMTMEHLSRLLSEETEWIVDQVQGKGPRTEPQINLLNILKPLLSTSKACSASLTKFGHS